MDGKKLAIAGGVGVAVLVALGLGFQAYTENLYEDSATSGYEYGVSVTYDGTLEDIRILVPAPSLDGASTIGDAIVDDPETWSPAQLDVTLNRTDRGPMLELTADELPSNTTYYRLVEGEEMGVWEPIDREAYEPGNPRHRVVHDGEIRVDLRVETEGEVETREPTGSEPLLQPKADLEEVSCPGPEGPGSVQGTCHRYAGSAYLGYDTASATNLSLEVELRGGNEWWVFGWSGNEYEDRARLEAVGPQAAWHPTVGSMVVGSGSYR